MENITQLYQNVNVLKEGDSLLKEYVKLLSGGESEQVRDVPMLKGGDDLLKQNVFEQTRDVSMLSGGESDQAGDV
jgi:hypothetical protein